MTTTCTVPASGPGTPAINYVVAGCGPHVMLVHGVGSSLHAWDGVAARLEAYFTVTRLDLRGHGRSGPITGPCTLDDLAADIVRVFDHMGVARGHLAGFSLGGLIAQALALSHGGRLDRIAILSAVAGRTAEERAKVVDRLGLLKEGGIRAVSAAAEERWFTPTFRTAHPEIVARRMAELLANDPISYAAAYSVFATGDLGDRLVDIRIPTLVTTGEHDAGSNVRMARMMHERIDGSRLVILPGLRHAVLDEAPDAIAGLLAQHFGAAV